MASSLSPYPVGSSAPPPAQDWTRLATDETGDAPAKDAADFRQQMVERIPRWYSPWAHLLGTTGVGVVATALAITRIEHLRAVELLVVPAVFVISNLMEWHAHRNLLHRRWRPFAVLYDRHTPEHHRVYRYQNMAIVSYRELRLVLIPAMGVFGIVLAAAPAAALCGWLLGANVGWLFLLTASLYVVSYELTHLAYHLPETHLVYRLPGLGRALAFLREHHARHHDPRLMQRYNFNVTVPLGDWLFSTFPPPELVARLTRREP